MTAPLGLAIRIFDHAPTVSHSSGSLTHQVWKGAATNVSSRAMMPDPPRWIVLSDREARQPPLDSADSLPAWDLEQITPGRGLSLTDASGVIPDAGGVILVSMDIDHAREDEFNVWYNIEHIPHLSTLPCVLAARRFRAISGSWSGAPVYVALYHVMDTDIYASRTRGIANETP